MWNKRTAGFVALVLLPLAGCLHRAPVPLPAVELGPPLTRLSRAVDAVTDLTPDSETPAVVPDGDPEGADGEATPAPAETLMGDPALLAAATAHDPSLLEPFHGYHVEAAARGGYGVVLVCTEDRTTALLEDAGCTAQLDRAWYREAQPAPCAFTIDPAALCDPTEGRGGSGN